MSQPTVTELLEKIAGLERTVVALALKLEKESNHTAAMFTLNTEIRTLIENEVMDAFERIKQIELTLFPNLAGDIVRLHRIVGEGDGRAWNPLDKRPE